MDILRAETGRPSRETRSARGAGGTTNTGVRFIIDPSQPLLRHLDAGHPPAPRIAVQWVPALTPELRRRAEAELGLSDPVRRTDASNWSYALDDTSRTVFVDVANQIDVTQPVVCVLAQLRPDRIHELGDQAIAQFTHRGALSHWIEAQLWGTR